MEEQHDLAKWLAGDMDESELKAFQESAEFKMYDKIAKYSSQLETKNPDDEQMLRNIFQHPKKQKQPKVISMQKSIFIKIAAVLIIGLGLFLLSKPFTTEKQYAENGKRSTFLLPDDSEVAINSGSEIKYKKWNWNDNRSLELKGEAFFKVAKGKTFDVNTELGTITVVGTQFNVRAREKRFEVECFEGKVKVQFGSQKVMLTKGKIVVIDNGKVISAQPTNGDKPYWMNHEIRLNSVPLSEIISEMERQYNVKIALKNIRSNADFTGMIPSNNLENALKILGKTYNLQYQITKNTVILSPNA